jgi:DNA gyrase subunit A
MRYVPVPCQKANSEDPAALTKSLENSEKGGWHLVRVRGEAGERVVVGAPWGVRWDVACGTGRLWALSSGGTLFELTPIDAPKFDMFGKAPMVPWTPKLSPRETFVWGMIAPEDLSERFLVCVTARGRFNKTPCERFCGLRQTGLAAIQVERLDHLVTAVLTREDDTVWAVTRDGRLSMIPLAHVIPTARASSGTHVVKTRRASEGIVAVGVVAGNDPLWIVTEFGFVQRVETASVPRDLVGKNGAQSVHIGKDNGTVVGAVQREDRGFLRLTTDKDRTLEVSLAATHTGPSLTAGGGALSGVPVVKLEDGEKILALA